jgi:reverse transcriptase-like protein
MEVGQLREQEEPAPMTRPYAIPKRLVWEAFQRVKANGGASGVDAESIADFEKKLGDNLYKLWSRMESGSYFPPPVKAVPIPKKSGGMRILGVPTVADRVAQTVVKQVLEPILEPVFDNNSYGYRPGRSAHDAIALVRRRNWEYDWVVEFDIKGLLDPSSHYTSRCGMRAEEVGGSGRELDSQAFLAADADMHGVQLAALYTLQDRLARDAQKVGGFEHGDVAFGDVRDEACAQFIIESDAPGSAGRDLFAGDEAMVEPAVQGRGRDAQRVRGALDGHRLGRVRLLRRLEARDVPVRTQTAYPIGSKRQSGGGLATLPVEDAGDDGIRVVLGQATQQIDGVVGSANRGGMGARQGNLDFAEESAVPAQHEVSIELLARDTQGDLLE